jgi:hypothetical protein
LDSVGVSAQIKNARVSQLKHWEGGLVEIPLSATGITKLCSLQMYEAFIELHKERSIGSTVINLES